MAEEAYQYEPKKIGDNNLRQSLMKDPKLFAEKILKSEAVTCSITLPVQQHTSEGTNCITTTIPFYMSNNFSIGDLTNQWNELVDTSGENLFANLLNYIQAIQKESQVTMQSEAMSSKIWKGSKFGGFSVDCLFVATRRTINPTKIIRLLASTALPDKLRKDDATTAQSFTNVKNGVSNLINGGVSIANLVIDGAQEFASGLNKELDVKGAKQVVSDMAETGKKLLDDVGMIAPLYYGVKTNSKDGRPIAPLDNTTVTLQVGDWFRADELLVESVGGIQFSKEIIAPPMTDNRNFINGKGGASLYDNSPNGSDYGYPLWGKCTLRLIPFSMMHREKFNSYFIDKEYDNVMNILKGSLGSLVGLPLGQSSSMFDLPN